MKAFLLFSPPKHILLLVACLAVVAVSSGLLAQQTPAGQPELQNVFIGETQPQASILKERAEQQIEQATSSLGVFHDFRFSDTYLQSGIDFSHKPTDDGIKHYAMVHYDHGNGILVADVDGDERLDLYLISQFGRNELWRNLGGGKFENITDTAGVGMADRISVTGSFADIDNDGDADLFVTTVRMGNMLFENDGTGKFKDITDAAGVGHVGHSSGTVFFDYDRDGLLDLFVTNVGVYTTDERGREGYYVGVPDAFAGHLKPERFERSILYKNTGGNKFVDVTEKTGLIDMGWAGDASIVDFNRDGYLDLYVLNMQGDDHYYENAQGERFEEKTAQYFPKTPWGAMGIKWFDVDNNGLMDMILTDMHSDMSEGVPPAGEKLKSNMPWEDKYLQDGSNNVFGNAFYLQVEPGKFEEVSDTIGAENYWPWGVSVDDINADGFDDVLITSSMNYPYRYGVNSLLLNNKGKKLIDVEFLLGIEPRVHGMTMRPWFPLDCSGEDADHKICQDNDLAGQFLVWGTLGTRTAAIFDLDDDGDLDIVTGDFNSQSQIFISDLTSKRDINYLKVSLVGSKSARDGLGARVAVVAGDKRYTKIYDGKSGYLSQSRMPLYFGLGDAKTVDSIEVIWPSGTKQTVPNPGAINRLVRISEADAK